jgi:hypothetical protein
MYNQKNKKLEGRENDAYVVIDGANWSFQLFIYYFKKLISCKHNNFAISNPFRVFKKCRKLQPPPPTPSHDVAMTTFCYQGFNNLKFAH